MQVVQRIEYMKKAIKIKSMPYSKNKSSKGFTLVEILVVVLIIGILGTILIKTLNVQGLQRKTRDSQRKSDLRQIQTSLELYFADNREYPIDTDNSGPGLGALVPDYISVLPTDPDPLDLNEYEYISTDGTKYGLGCSMEIISSVDDGHACTESYSFSGANCYEILPPSMPK